MNTHCFDEDIKVQKFCFTLLGEARLWYQSLEPLGDITWAQLQNLFPAEIFKIMQHLQTAISCVEIIFTFNKNTETIDSYVIRIRQVANLLGYGEPQI